MKAIVAWISLAAFVLAMTRSTASAQTGGPLSSTSFSQEILDAHNGYRKAVGVPPLVWSKDLARSARAWAETLTSNLDFAHDTSNRGQGENLWMGTDGVFSLADMVGGWASERHYFQNRTFPNVSTTGNWFDVGHYTQMVWRNTTRVGCAGVSGSDGYYRLVCRYWPPGNVFGQRAL